MKKFLASLLSLTMLCSSVVVLCSAEEKDLSNGMSTSESMTEEKQNGQEIPTSDASQKEIKIEEVNTNLGASEPQQKIPTDDANQEGIKIEEANTNLNNPEDKDKTESSSSSEASSEKESFLRNFSNYVSSFCRENQHGLTVAGIATATVVVLGTTVYVFRNEIKVLAQKTVNTLKSLIERIQNVA